MVICLVQGADLHIAQLMPLPLTVSCFSKIQIGFTFLVPPYLGSPGKGPLNGCVCVCSAAQKAVKQTWTEHQDEELKTLFKEFFQLPQDSAAELGPLVCFLILITSDNDDVIVSQALECVAWWCSG